jgi:hypothetical protein
LNITEPFWSILKTRSLFLHVSTRESNLLPCYTRDKSPVQCPS